MLAISPAAAPYEPPGLSAAQSPDPTEAPPDAASAPAVIASSTEALPPAPMTLSPETEPADPIAESTRTAAVQTPPVHWPTIAASPGADAALSARIEAAFAPLEGIRSLPAGGVTPAVEFSAMPSMRAAEAQAGAILRRVDRIRAEVRSRALTPGGDWPANSRRW
ncbi:MAG: hypothetical protein D6744_02945 [Planctomycetota bacterium]|nr:MAG: hypothetical protein D6744_02945 [Planctomycetota bacterium]